jgi:hypothetical protein
MRFISAKLGERTFDVRNGVPVTGGKFPHVLVGTRSLRNRGFERIPVGAEFAKSIKYTPCPRNGSGAIGPCPACGTFVVPGMVRQVEAEVNGMKVSIPYAEHDGVGMIYRATPFFTVKGERLMIAEERRAANDRVVLLLSVEGEDVRLEFPTMELEEKKFHRSGVLLDSADCVVGAMHFVVVLKNDEIVAHRNAGTFHETITIKMGDDLYPRILSVVREEIKAPAAQAESKASPAVEDSPQLEASPEIEFLSEPEETEIKFE